MARLTAPGPAAGPATATGPADARAMLLLLLLVQVTLMAAPPAGLAAAGLVALASWLRLRVPTRELFRALRGFAVLAAVIVLSHLFFGGGEAESPPSGEAGGAGGLSAWLSQTRLQAFRAGLELAGRLLAVVAAGVIFTASVGSDGLARALGWYLRPLLGQRSARLALMARLALRSVTLLGRDARELQDALGARGLSPRRRPWRYLSLLGGNTVLRAIHRAEAQSMAVSARGYADRPPVWRSSGPEETARQDWLWAAAGSVICLAGWVLGSCLPGGP